MTTQRYLHRPLRLIFLVFLFTAAFSIPEVCQAASSKSWNEIIVEEIGKNEDGGGYSTARNTSIYPQTAWRGMARAWSWSKREGISIDMGKARPSFCSCACYMMLLKALSVWDEDGTFSKSAWIALRPYTVKRMKYKIQDDGVGCWGYANANGPGIAMLVRKLGAGQNYYIGSRSEYRSTAKYYKAWKKAKEGDFLKIFRDDEIGCRENGHQVIFMGRERAYRDGMRDDKIYFWSSQGSTNGYGTTWCYASNIRRAVLTKITDPDVFRDADLLLPPTGKNKWLASLLKKRVSVKSLKSHIRTN